MLFVPPFKRASRSEPSVEELALRDDFIRIAKLSQKEFSPEQVLALMASTTRKKIYNALELAVKEDPTIASDLIRVGQKLGLDAMIRAGAKYIKSENLQGRYDIDQQREAIRVLAELKNK